MPPPPSDIDSQPVPLRTRIVSAVLLSLFCLSIYGAVNALAGMRGITRSLATGWDMAIPRLNWFVIPYWSIDLMLGLSPIFATTRGEWRTLLKRLFWAFTVACLIFLLFPFRCAYPRGIPEDWTGPFFAVLHATDLPYNQAPSLHVAEAILFAPVYLAKIVSPLLRMGLVIWIALGCVSTVLTHQHHLVDLVTGALFGLLLFRLIPGAYRSRSPA